MTLMRSLIVQCTNSASRNQMRAIVELAPDSPSAHSLAGAFVNADALFHWLTNPGSVATQCFRRACCSGASTGRYTALSGRQSARGDRVSARHICPCNTIAIEAVKSSSSSTL